MKKKIIVISVIIYVLLISLLGIFFLSLNKYSPTSNRATNKTSEEPTTHITESSSETTSLTTTTLTNNIEVSTITLSTTTTKEQFTSKTVSTTMTTTKTTTSKITTSTSKTTSKNKFVSYNGNLNIKNNTLVNQYGEKIQLKGMSTHGIQWYGDFANESMIKELKNSWGSNLFRIAMYTSEGGYLSHKSIKNKVNNIVNLAIKYDMYVIIDWHILSDGNPLTSINEAKQFFDEMSKTYKNVPNVIYEICNEPNGGVTWNEHIKPYADEIVNVIRKNSKNSIIIVGTGTWSQDVLDAANNPINDSRVMYAVHFYAGTHTDWLRDRVSNAIRKVPVFISEWGVSDASGSGGVYLSEAQKWVDFMKKNNISWANWSLCDKYESSALLKPGSPKDSLSDRYLSESGLFVKKAIKDN